MCSPVQAHPRRCSAPSFLHLPLSSIQMGCLCPTAVLSSDPPRQATALFRHGRRARTAPDLLLDSFFPLSQSSRLQHNLPPGQLVRTVYVHTADPQSNLLDRLLLTSSCGPVARCEVPEQSQHRQGVFEKKRKTHTSHRNRTLSRAGCHVAIRLRHYGSQPRFWPSLLLAPTPLLGTCLRPSH